MTRKCEKGGRVCHWCRRPRIWLLAAILLAPGPLWADRSDYVVAFGAGTVGVWGTEFTVSSVLDEASEVILSRVPTNPLCPPLIQCHTIVPLPARGTAIAQPPPDNGLSAVYVGTVGKVTPPSVLARAYSVAGASVDLPVFQVSTLLALNPSELNFPGARRGATGRCNLMVANVADPNVGFGQPVNVRIEAFSAGGGALGHAEVSLGYGETTFISDVLGFLGIAELDNGQLVLTKSGGEGVFWGIMPISRSDGSLSVSLGTAP